MCVCEGICGNQLMKAVLGHDLGVVEVSLEPTGAKLGRSCCRLQLGHCFGDVVQIDRYLGLVIPLAPHVESPPLNL